MVNSHGSEHQSPSRRPVRLVVSVLLLGTLMSWWGTRDHRRLFGGSPREPVAAGAAALPPVGQDQSALLDRGSQLAQQECAGCHETAARSSGPSYREIVTFYRRQFPASAGSADLRSRLASAVTHPQPGWGNFAPGPAESGLSPDDRIALASWILNSSDRGNNAGKGAAP
jgi:cytochrome c551/c552